MTTYVQARDAITAHVQASIEPHCNLYYSNTKELDLDTAPSPFVRMLVRFEDAKQATVEHAPLRRVYGAVIFQLLWREGPGEREVLALVDLIETETKFKNLSGVQMQTPMPGGTRSADGWEGRELRVPFWFDSTP